MSYTTPTSSKPYGSYYNPYQYGKKKKVSSPVSMESSLDPNQQGLADQLPGMLSNIQSPEDFLSGLSTFIGQQSPFMGAGGEGILGAIQNAMKGKIDEGAFQSSVATPMRKEWQDYGAPTAREEFGGPGTYWGTARGQAVERGRESVEGRISEERGKMAQLATQNALQAALGYGGMLSQNVGNWIEAYTAANPSQAETINTILAYLNTPTQIAYQNPEYIPGAIKKAMKSTATPMKSTATPYTGNIPGQMYLPSAGGYV